MLRFKVTPLLVAALLCSALPLAWAQASSDAKKRLPIPLSRHELRLCMDRSDEIDRRKAALDRAMESHEAAMAPIAGNAGVLAEDLRRLDAGNELAVDAYNERVKKHSEAVDAYNRRTDALNASVAELHLATADYFEQCGTRSYLRRDHDAILKERGVKPPAAKGDLRIAPPPSRPANAI
jgi:methyl-accepting chemotaxis protein